MKTHYYVETWDTELQQWTPQAGVRKGPYTLFGLRKAIRKLWADYGYEANRRDASIYVSRVEKP